jgi:pimeloyl-ACP methyl ester carboxylesterase
MRKILIGLLIVIAALAGAFWYVSTPDIPRAELEKKYATGASQFVVLPDGARAHFRDQGPRGAQILLLIHGSNASLFTWEPWVSRLDHTFRVVTVDMPGHGLTGAVPSGDYSQEGMVKFTEEFAGKIGLKQFALGGNSMGGAVAARFAEEHPGRVTRLILVDAGGMQTRMGDHVPLAFRIGRTPVVNLLLLYITPRSIVKEGLDDAFVHKKLVSGWMIDRYWDFARMEGSREATLKRFNLPWDTSIKDHIAAIKAPTLILWGAQDHLVPVEAAHAYNDAIKGSKLIVYPDAGHVLQEDLPDQSAADVRAFLQNSPPSP